jgi:diguanylate cyclase (GGDEF)-like protein
MGSKERATPRAGELVARYAAAVNGASHARRDGPLDVDASAALRSRSALPTLPTDFAAEDLGDLLGAVKARLCQTVAERLSSLPELQSNDEAQRIQANVLECVSALDQLQTTLQHDFARRQQLEMDAFDARTALAQARAELAGTQAGERRARYLALHDGLTSLPNRSHFREQMDRALSHADLRRRGMAVLYLDLDAFKSINDENGHDVGDDLLRIVAARLTRTLRAEDTIGRLGGDEFACLVAGMPGRDHLLHLARKLFQAVSAPLKIGELRLSVRPSIGIAMCPDDGTTVESLLKHADAAMYRAKRQQVGHAFFSQQPAD